MDKYEYLNEDDTLTINFMKNEQSYMVIMGTDYINVYKIFENKDDELINSINIK